MWLTSGPSPASSSSTWTKLFSSPKGRRMSQLKYLHQSQYNLKKKIVYVTYWKLNCKHIDGTVLIKKKAIFSFQFTHILCLADGQNTHKTLWGLDSVLDRQFTTSMFKCWGQYNKGLSDGSRKSPPRRRKKKGFATCLSKLSFQSDEK